MDQSWRIEADRNRALHFWCSPDGQLYSGLNHVKILKELFGTMKESEVCRVAYTQGFLRCVVFEGYLHFHHMMVPAKPKQLKSLQDYCIENNLRLFSDNTNREV